MRITLCILAGCIATIGGCTLGKLNPAVSQSNSTRPKLLMPPENTSKPEANPYPNHTNPLESESVPSSLVARYTELEELRRIEQGTAQMQHTMKEEPLGQLPPMGNKAFWFDAVWYLGTCVVLLGGWFWLGIRKRRD